jgi:hypothetical protein
MSRSIWFKGSYFVKNSEADLPASRSLDMWETIIRWFVSHGSEGRWMRWHRLRLGSIIHELSQGIIQLKIRRPRDFLERMDQWFRSFDGKCNHMTIAHTRMMHHDRFILFWEVVLWFLFVNNDTNRFYFVVAVITSQSYHFRKYETKSAP